MLVMRFEDWRRAYTDRFMPVAATRRLEIEEPVLACLGCLRPQGNLALTCAGACLIRCSVN